MLTPVLEGDYRDGEVTLDELPEGIRRARVRVTFVPGTEVLSPQAERTREEAVRRLRGFMRQGFDFGSGPLKRSEIYEERLRDLGTQDG